MPQFPNDFPTVVADLPEQSSSEASVLAITLQRHQGDGKIRRIPSFLIITDQQPSRNLVTES